MLQIGESYQGWWCASIEARNISFPSQGASWTKIDDIDEVVDEDIALRYLIQSAKIIGAHLTKYAVASIAKKGM